MRIEWQNKNIGALIEAITIPAARIPVRTGLSF
jgi:hypothetical protein